ncbi:site-specific integrase [Candidatus Woesearchaeota archaeon]|nr:site-specific integrase [Candidatus Woesearchaeota archaeon]MBI4155076.1 site-specific integrase [Candidatus Woesearchaeota archaeon]
MTNNQMLLYEETKKLPEFFSPLDLTKVFETIQNSTNYLKNDWGEFMRYRDKSIVACIYFLAARPKEICCLRFDDFDLENLTVKIRGENNKQKKDRILPIPQQILPYLKDFFAFDRFRFWKGSQYLFPSLENPHISTGRLKHIFREKILKPAGLWKPAINSTVPPYRAYTLRHTRLSQIYNETKDIFLVANTAGHSHLSSSKVYVHTDKNYLEYMREKLNKN